MVARCLTGNPGADRTGHNAARFATTVSSRGQSGEAIITQRDAGELPASAQGDVAAWQLLVIELPQAFSDQSLIARNWRETDGMML